MHRFAQGLKNRKIIWIILLATALLFVALTTVYLHIGSYAKYIINPSETSSKNIRVGIVFGAGIAPNGKPYDELIGRLEGAAELFKDGSLDKLLVSGDNRFANYNEPQAMQDYLVYEKQIPVSAIQQDNAGRSTYETCERANKIFGLDQAILITSSSHLPRAIFTCRKMGVESYGAAYGQDANNALRREFLARSKAVFNIYVWGEQTVLGDPIEL